MLTIELAPPLPPADVDDRPGVATRAPRVLVFDSGLGGLTVLAAIREAMPGAEIAFAADDAVFPYGRLDEETLVSRVVAVMDVLIARRRPDVIVIACNTASTLVLPPLRARWPDIAVVGTVPAIKPAAALSRSRLVSVLATPGTVARQYTRDLVDTFAGDCRVTLVGSSRLAALAEAAMRGEVVPDAAILGEMAPAFVADGARRTDVVVLACTHYPLLLATMQRLQPWPVAWIDPAMAIARRAANVASDRGFAVMAPRTEASIPAMFTSGRAPGDALTRALGDRGLAWQPCAPV